jgi:hypothetical protein
MGNDSNVAKMSNSNICIANAHPVITPKAQVVWEKANKRPRLTAQIAYGNEEPRRKQRGIFVGAEIYFTGGGHSQFAYDA